jgi:hypothetical protein
MKEFRRDLTLPEMLGVTLWLLRNHTRNLYQELELVRSGKRKAEDAVWGADDGSRRRRR